MSRVLQRPSQAVVLAGGQGTRLRPLTETRPKAMIEFHGKPFLEYVVELLRDQGFARILLLLGYRPEAIQTYFGDGSRWGVQIDYSISAVEDETGRRLKLAASRLDAIFLLLYCDNYWPMRIDRMWQHFAMADAPALLTVYQNSDGYTKSNVRVDGSGYIVSYDKSRSEPGLQGVEIGFSILRREVLDELPNEGNVSFERAVYPHLAARRQLRAFVTAHRYYSVGSFERLPVTDEFLARRPTIILDRDGVLNRKPPRAQYVCSWKDWHWLPGARDALRLFKEAGFRVIIASNQAGIARGVLTESALTEIHRRLRAEAELAGGAIDAIYYCPHGWDDGCDCRKPQPGLFYQAQRDFQLDLSRTYMIGDDERDRQAADAAGCLWRCASEAQPLLEVADELVRHGPVDRPATVRLLAGEPSREGASPRW